MRSAARGSCNSDKCIGLEIGPQPGWCGRDSAAVTRGRDQRSAVSGPGTVRRNSGVAGCLARDPATRTQVQLRGSVEDFSNLVQQIGLREWLGEVVFREAQIDSCARISGDANHLEIRRAARGAAEPARFRPSEASVNPSRAGRCPPRWPRKATGLSRRRGPRTRGSLRAPRPPLPAVGPPARLRRRGWSPPASIRFLSCVPGLDCNMSANLEAPANDIATWDALRLCRVRLPGTR